MNRAVETRVYETQPMISEFLYRSEEELFKGITKIGGNLCFNLNLYFYNRFELISSVGKSDGSTDAFSVVFL